MWRSRSSRSMRSSVWREVVAFRARSSRSVDLVALDLVHHLAEGDRLEQAAHLEMIAEAVLGQAAGIPALVHVLGDEPGPLEPGQHLMRHGPAHLVVLGERALVDQEAAEGQHAGDGVLDRRVDALAAVPDLEVGGDLRRQPEAGIVEFQAERTDIARAGQVAAALEIAEQALRGGGAGAPQRRGRGSPGRRGRRSDSPRTRPGGKAAVLDVLAEHRIDHLVERRRRLFSRLCRAPRHLGRSSVSMRVQPSTRCRSIASQSQAMPRPGSVGRHRAAIDDLHPLRGQAVELRDVFDPAPVRHGRRQRDMQLHQEMRADRHVEGFGEVRGLQPRRDAADARHVDLDDARRVALQVFAEMREAVDRLADRDRQRGRGGEADMAAEVLGRQRLLVPGEVEGLVEPGAPDRLVDLRRPGCRRP